MAKIAHLCVANLGNSLAITCDLRLDLHNFISSSTRPRIDQRLLKAIAIARVIALNCAKAAPNFIQLLSIMFSGDNKQALDGLSQFGSDVSGRD
jgi:hypothetical protein